MTNATRIDASQHTSERCGTASPMPVSACCSRLLWGWWFNAVVCPACHERTRIEHRCTTCDALVHADGSASRRTFPNTLHTLHTFHRSNA